MITPLNTAPEPSPMAVLLGGEEDRYLRNDGGYEAVKVNILPMRLRLRYVELMIEGDGQAIVELCCGEKPPQWADQFHPAAQDALFRKARDLNFTLAVQYLEQLQDDSKKLAPLYQKVAKRMIDQAGPLLQQLFSSFTPAPTPVSPSAAPASKSSTNLPRGYESSSSEKAPPTPAAPLSNSTL